MTMTQQEIDEILACMGEEVIEAIQAMEREIIVEFLRCEEMKYELCEDAADLIEELGHYEDEEIH